MSSSPAVPVSITLADRVNVPTDDLAVADVDVELAVELELVVAVAVG